MHREQRDFCRQSDAGLTIAGAATPFSFTGNSGNMRLASEAYRISLAHLFDPYLAVHTSLVEPLPHQISAVYGEMLPKQPLRFLLADDPGAGKTIMTGLLLKELIARGDVARCLIVAPGSLVEQWQDEMLCKFHLRFEMLTNERIEAAGAGNVLAEIGFCIARLDKLARDEALQEKIKETSWDLVVCDEAHKMSATVFGGEAKYTKRFRLGQLLSQAARHFLLLTATPHNGKEADFQLFLSLIDADRFAMAGRGADTPPADVSGIMRRLVKEDMLRFDGSPLFPERHAVPVNYELSRDEAALYEAVTEYVQQEFNRAEKLKDERRKNSVGFALTILQRRLASSPEAIYQSLARRRKRLEESLAELRREGSRGIKAKLALFSIPDDLDDLAAYELESLENRLSCDASAASGMHELQGEIEALKRLEAEAAFVRGSGDDRKWKELSSLLQENARMFDERGRREKIIIFTEHRDTLDYLYKKISSLLGQEERVVAIHGGLSREKRREAEARFKEDGDACVMIATDAAGEGINLQRAHLMVNYDLPWNPNRLEQRFGRIHRIGQTQVCWLWNLVAHETREGQVFARLLEKLEQEKKALGGKVFDILGKVSFTGRPLRDLLVEAVRYGSDTAVQARLAAAVDASLDTKALLALMNENSLAHDAMDKERAAAIREDMERAEARKLQPHFIESFFLKAFTELKGKIARREEGRYEITYVPGALRSRGAAVGSLEPVMPKYERVCFDKRFIGGAGKKPASLICPGHSLMEAVTGLIRERHVNLLRQGAIFVDEMEEGADAPLRLLVYIESVIKDGAATEDGARRVVSRQLHFVELDGRGGHRNAGPAPYLDYSDPTAEEAAAVLEWLPSQGWLAQGGAEEAAIEYAAKNIIPEQLSSIKRIRVAVAEKTEKAVHARLTDAIQSCEFRAVEQQKKADAGKPGAATAAAKLEKEAMNLTERMHARIRELAKEKEIGAEPPIIAGAALVAPRGLLRRLMGAGDDSAAERASAEGKKQIEMAAMRAVAEIERSLGFEPRDVSAENCGYDIESKTLGGDLRFIEVKGRRAGADTVTVTANEILAGLNKSDDYLLALVEVDGERCAVTYIARPFLAKPDWATRSITYTIADLCLQGEVVLSQGVELGRK